MMMLRTASLCLLLATACAKTTTPDQGTNTNWLEVCDEESDCDADDACLCGVCTKPCSEDDQCGAVHAATTCQALEASACGTNGDAVSACLQGCESDRDCTALEDGHCDEGVCVPDVPPMSTVDASEPDSGPLDSSMPDPDGSTPLTNPFTLPRDGNEVVITGAYTACSHHDHCIIVSTGCDGCCQQGALHTDLEETFDIQFELACEGVTNGGCPCEPALLFPACREGHCVALEPIDDCYAPTANLDIAYASGARGCDCPVIGQSICVGPAALICEGLDSDPPEQRWYSVEDGPCGEPTPDPSCNNGEVRETADACLADFMTCYQIAGGAFCGVDPIE